MKNIISIISIMFLVFLDVSGQQLPQFTQYLYNTVAINPAYAGSREALNITALNRNQWVGFKGGPNTQTLSIHSPLRNEKIGLGVSIMKDKAGYEDFTYFYSDFSFTIKANENLKIAFGLKGGASFYKIDPNLFTDDKVMQDPFFEEKLNRWTPNIGAGVYVHTNKWFLGLSTPRFINHNLKKNTNFVALERIHYYALGGMVFELNENVKFKPSFMSKYTRGAPLSVDLSANFLFNEKLWLGTSWRLKDALGAVVDIRALDQLRIGYAFEYPITDIGSYSSGTHEIILIYEFKFLKDKMKSPRYF